MVIPSLFHHMVEVSKEIDQEMQDTLGEGLDFYRRLCIMEALQNAIQHGNKCVETKKVFIYVEASPHRFYFVVRDEGEGFDFTNLPDPRSKENLEKVGGRGIFLMRHFMDEVRFVGKGNEIHLIQSIE